jgi:hypothetical protein
MNTKQLYGSDFTYSLARGYRAGVFATMLAPEKDARATISPRGLYAKGIYNFWHQDLLSEDKGITFEGGKPIENFDIFKYDELGLRLKYGMSSPWYDLHDLYAEINVSSMVPHQQLLNKVFGSTDSIKNVPAYYKLAGWLPGYTYYYETKGKRTTSSDSLKYDTLLITGNAISLVALSYRFPLWPKPLIDQKLWFIYFERLYGVVNFNAGAGWNSVSDALKFHKEDWLSSAGLELRCEAQSWGYPLAFKFRWDRGFNRPSAVGGDHFTVSIGTSFDNWEYIDLPDYRSPITQRTQYY